MTAERVLIVDDAVVMRMMIKGILSKNGYEVVGEAQNGAEAVEKYRELGPDLVTMDMVMPEMDGISAVKQIVANDPDARIIMCTSMGQQALVVEAIQAGAKSFITKPFQPPKILETIQKVLGMTESLTLSELQRDALKEVGNIGAGHAATALSQLLNTTVKLSEPRIDVLKFRDLSNRIGSGDRAVAALHMYVRGEAPGQMVVLFDRDQAQEFVNVFIKRIIGDIQIFDSIIDSTLKELGNIIAGSYLTALISLTGINLLPSVPTLSYGTVQAAFRTLMSILPDQDVFLIESQFLDKDRAVSGQFILIPETGSLEPLLSVFGVE